jgi:hypothetical protein
VIDADHAHYALFVLDTQDDPRGRHDTPGVKGPARSRELAADGHDAPRLILYLKRAQ